MDSVLDAAVQRIKNFTDDVDTLKADLSYTTNSISKQETKAALIGGQFIETCFALFEHQSLSPSHRVQLLDITQKLAVLYSARRILVSSEPDSFIPSIAAALRSGDEHVRHSACKLVKIVCSFEDSLNAVASSPITPILYDLLFDASHDVVSETLHSLSSITNQIRDTPEKVVAKLIAVLRATDKADVARCESNLSCLWNICAVWQIKELAIQHQIVDATAKFLSTTFAKAEPAVCRRAAGLLMPISVCEAGKDAIIAAKGIVSALSYLVSNKYVADDIQRNSGIVLCNIGDHPQGLLLIGKELIHKHGLLIRLFGHDRAAAIGQHFLASEKQLIQQSAVQLLALVAQHTPGGIDAVWKCRNVLPQLIDVFMLSEKDRIVSLALDCILMLCQTKQTAQRILRKEARRSKPFLETARKIEQLKPFLDADLI